MHEILIDNSCSNITAVLEDLLFCNNPRESRNKTHQKYSFPLKKVIEHGRIALDLISDNALQGCK